MFSSTNIIICLKEKKNLLRNSLITYGAEFLQIYEKLQGNSSSSHTAVGSYQKWSRIVKLYHKIYTLNKSRNISTDSTCSSNGDSADSTS